MPAFPFCGGAYESRTLSSNAQSCINLYPEIDQTGKGGGQNKTVLYSTPGCKLLIDTGTNKAVRGLHAWDDQLFLVSGLKFYEIFSNGTKLLRGTLSSSASASSRISMAHNSSQLLIVDGSGVGHIYVPSTTTLSKLSDPDFPGGAVATYSDGYFLLTKPNTQEMYISKVQDGFNWDPLDFVSSEGAPDKLVSIMPNHREIWTFGSQTTEVYYNSGDATFPFERIQGAFIELGCAAAHSVAQLDTTLFWLAQDIRGNGLICRAQGYTPTIVSTRALETEMLSYPSISDAYGFSYQQGGHSFYFITFPSAGKTWVYDVEAQLWHERSFYDMETGPTRHLANAYAFCWGKHLVGDFRTGKLHEMDLNTYTDDGGLIVRERTSPYVHEDRHRISYYRFEVDMEFGDGVPTGTDPKVMLQYSEDGARTWSNEIQASIGKQGEYLTRAVWRRLGSGRQRIFKVSTSEAQRVAMLGGYIDVIKAAF